MPCPHCGNQSPLIETPDFIDYCRFCCRGVSKHGPDLDFTEDMKQDDSVLRVKWVYFVCDLCGKMDRKKNNSTRTICRSCRDSATRRLTRLSNPFYTYNDTSSVRVCDFCGREIRAGAKRYKKRNSLTWACAQCYKEKISTRRKK
jgi:hypothetical protein